MLSSCRRTRVRCFLWLQAQLGLCPYCRSPSASFLCALTLSSAACCTPKAGRTVRTECVQSTDQVASVVPHVRRLPTLIMLARFFLLRCKVTAALLYHANSAQNRVSRVGSQDRSVKGSHHGCPYIAYTSSGLKHGDTSIGSLQEHRLRAGSTCSPQRAS